VIFRFGWFPPIAGRGGETLSLGTLASRSLHLLAVYAAQQVFPVIPTLGAEVLQRRPWVDVVALALLVALIAIARPRRDAAAAVLWLCAFLAPVLWVNAIKGVSVSDRFAYLPSVGVCALAALAATRFWERRRVSRLVTAVVIVAFGGLSFLYSRMWHDAVTLWRAGTIYHPQSGLCHYNLAWAYYDEQNITGAVRAMYKAARTLTDREKKAAAFTNLARFLAAAGEDDQAVLAARQGMRLKGNSQGYRSWLVSFLSELGRHREAIAELETLHEAMPQNAGVCLALAQEYLALQPPDLDLARTWYDRARTRGAPPNESIEAALKQPAPGP
jgi:tetratricopeptide (TPR) repeat protein